MKYLYIKFVIILVIILLSACNSNPSYPTRTPLPLPTAYPLIDSSRANAQSIANALPAVSKSNGLNGDPIIESFGNYWQVTAYYGGTALLGRYGGDAIFRIFATESAARSHYSGFRTAPEWYWDYGDEAMSNDGFAIVRIANVVLILEGYNNVDESDIRQMVRDMVNAMQNPSVLTTARQAVVTPTATDARAPFGSTSESPIENPPTNSPNPEESQGFFEWILGMLRDPFWGGISAIVSILAILGIGISAKSK